MKSMPISVRLNKMELARLDFVLEEACKVVPVTRHRLIREAIRRGLREVLKATERKEGIPVLGSGGGP